RHVAGDAAILLGLLQSFVQRQAAAMVRVAGQAAVAIVTHPLLRGRLLMGIVARDATHLQRFALVPARFALALPEALAGSHLLNLRDSLWLFVRSGRPDEY